RLNIVKTPDTGKLGVFANNIGNVDARTLPRPADAEVTQAGFDATFYRTAEKPGEVSKLWGAELSKRGWRVCRSEQEPKDADGPRHLLAIQRGSAVSIYIKNDKDRFEVMYWARLLQEELPIMPDESGSIEFRDAPVLLLEYLAKADVARALEF